jgi:hypothetical protein
MLPDEFSERTPTVPPPVPGVICTHSVKRLGWNPTATVREPFIVTLHVKPLVESQKCQPVNIEPVFSAAVKLTVWPSA